MENTPKVFKEYCILPNMENRPIDMNVSLPRRIFECYIFDHLTRHTVGPNEQKTISRYCPFKMERSKISLWNILKGLWRDPVFRELLHTLCASPSMRNTLLTELRRDHACTVQYRELHLPPCETYLQGYEETRHVRSYISLNSKHNYRATKRPRM